MKNFLLSYGTLRSGNINPGEDEKTICRNRDKIYNFNRFGANSQKFLKKFRLSGFSLVNVGYYPAAIEDENGEITVELQEVADENVWLSMQRMEKGAGYLWKQIEIDGVFATIFFMTQGRAAKLPKIESGDWCNF